MAPLFAEMRRISGNGFMYPVRDPVQRCFVVSFAETGLYLSPRIGGNEGRLPMMVLSMARSILMISPKTRSQIIFKFSVSFSSIIALPGPF